MPFRRLPGEQEWMAIEAPARCIEVGESIPRRIFAAWTGDNPMSENRRAGFDCIQRMHPDVEVVLVTNDNLDDWLVPGHPLPAAYKHLSFVHRSDYLHCYLLHHHGGGYVGIKRLTQSWLPSFDLLESSNKWLLGYTEPTKVNAALVGGQMAADFKRVWPQLLGFGGMISRSYTPLTTDWYNRLCHVVNEKSAELERNPGGIWGTEPGYPFTWTEVLATIVHPLMWKYQSHLIHDDRVKPVLRRYR